MKERYFKLCKKLSKSSNHHSHHLGACIVKGNSVLGIGWNQNKTHTKSSHSWKHIHAEDAAIRSALGENLNGAVIYVYRENKAGIPSLSFPCKYCLDTIKKTGIKKICFSIDNGYAEKYL